MDDIICRVVDMDDCAPAVTVLDENGDYNVYINARLSNDGTQEAWRHEMSHIRKGHFYDDIKPAAKCEREVASV